MSEIALADSRELTMIDEEQLVTMTVDGQLFGIPILKVQDIVEPDQITPVPLAPGAIAGVLNLRGRIVTVIDMRELLGGKSNEEQVKQMSVTVEYKGDLFTFLVDSIGDVRSLPRKHFDKPPATLDEHLRRLCSGVFRLEEDLLVVLDVDRMLDEENIMKTPKRTRKRRVLKSKTANENSEETNEEESSVKKLEGISQEDNKTSTMRDASSPKKPNINKTSSRNTATPKNSRNSGAATAGMATKAPSPKSSTKPSTTPAKAAAKTTATPKAQPAVGSRGPAASGLKADYEQKAMMAVERFADIVDADPILKDLYNNVAPDKLLELMVNLFNATFANPGAPLLDSAFKAFINQTGLADDHYMKAGMAIYQVLTELQVDEDISNNLMATIDLVRPQVLSVD